MTIQSSRKLFWVFLLVTVSLSFYLYLSHTSELEEIAVRPLMRLFDLPAAKVSSPKPAALVETPSETVRLISAPFRRSGWPSAISTTPDGAQPRRSASPSEMISSSTSAPSPTRSSWPPSSSPELPRSASPAKTPSTDAANFTSATDGALPALTRRARRSLLWSPSPELPRSEAEKSSIEAGAATARRLSPAPDQETAPAFSTYISPLVLPAPGTDPEYHLMPICKCVCAPCRCVPCKAVAPPVCNCNCLFPPSPAPAPSRSPGVNPKKKKDHWYCHWYIDLIAVVGLYLVVITLVRIFGLKEFKAWEEKLSNLRERWTMATTDSEAPEPEPKSSLQRVFEDLLRHYWRVIYYVGSILLFIALAQYYLSPIYDYFRGRKVHEPDLEGISILVLTFRDLL